MSSDEEEEARLTAAIRRKVARKRALEQQIAGLQQRSKQQRELLYLMAEERAPELAALRHDDEFDRALAALKELSGRELRSGEVRAVMHGAQAARRAKQWEREMRPLRRAEQDVCKAHNKKCSE